MSVVAGISSSGAITGSSLAISGTGTITTPATTDSSTTIATTAYVKNQAYAKYDVMNANFRLCGGGIVTWNGGTVTWTDRIIATNLGNSYAGSGFFQISPGTVNLGYWQALYYAPTNGMGANYDPTKLKVIQLDGGRNFTDNIGENWIFICGKHEDNFSLKWNPGFITIPAGGSYDSATGILTNPHTAAFGGINLTKSGGLFAITSVLDGTFPEGAFLNLSAAGGNRHCGLNFNPWKDRLGGIASRIFAADINFGVDFHIQTALGGNDGRNVATTRFFISHANGFVGINTTAPTTQLQVNGGITGKSLIIDDRPNGNYTNTSSGAGNYIYETGPIAVGPGNTAIGIQSFGLIASTVGFLRNSDSRIKKKIELLESNRSLNIIENLKPVTYNYIDWINNGTLTKYGYIAQEVEKYIPEAIHHSSEYIPNCFEMVDFSHNIITLQNSTTDIFDHVDGKSIKLKFYDISNNEILREIQEILDTKTFIINTPIPIEKGNNKKIFLYGHHVDDFLSIEHDQIQSILCSGIQELNKIVQEQQQKIEDLELYQEKQNTQIEELEKKIEFLMTKIT